MKKILGIEENEPIQSVDTPKNTYIIEENTLNAGTMFGFGLPKIVFIIEC